MDNASVFVLEPASVHWLAETFETKTAQHALLGSLAISAEAAHASGTAKGQTEGPDARQLVDLLSEQEVGNIVHDVAAAFPGLPIPREPGRAQLRAIDRLIRQGARERAPAAGRTPSVRGRHVRKQVGVVRTHRI